MNRESMELRYILLSQARLWDEQAPAGLVSLIAAIECFGFGNPPRFDAKLGRLVHRNGRIEAVEQIRQKIAVPAAPAIGQSSDVREQTCKLLVA